MIALLGAVTVPPREFVQWPRFKNKNTVTTHYSEHPHYKSHTNVGHQISLEKVVTEHEAIKEQLTSTAPKSTDFTSTYLGLKDFNLIAYSYQNVPVFKDHCTNKHHKLPFTVNHIQKTLDKTLLPECNSLQVLHCH